MNQYLTQGQIQLVIHANQPMKVKIKTTNKFYTHDCTILLPYQHDGQNLLLPTKEDCLLDYDEKSSHSFLQNNLQLLIEIASQYTIANIILEKNHEKFTIVGISYPALPTYINKEREKQTTSLYEKPELNYDGTGGYHWNWCFGRFPDDEDILDAY